MLWQLKEDVNVWSSLQNASSKLLAVPIVLIDDKGVSLSDAENSQAVYTGQNTKEFDAKSELRAAAYCIVRTKDYSIYRYSCNLVSIAFPIFVAGRYVGDLFMEKIRIKGQKSSEQMTLNYSDELRAVSKPYLEELIEFGTAFVEMIVNLVEARIKSGDYTFSSVKKNHLEPSYESGLIDKATAVLQGRNDKVYKLSELAEELNCSASTLKKHFARYLHEDFSAYYLKLKIVSAKDLLLATDETTNSISEMLGYSSPSVLYKSFKRKTGMTMTEFRERHHNA